MLASWYDARNTTGNNYERFGRLSTDNGATWGNDEVMSDVAEPTAAPARRQRPALLHGRLRPELQQHRGPLRLVGRRSRVDQRPLQQDVFFDKQAAGPPPPPSPNLVHDLATLYDGNSNGYIDPGESFGIDERIRNAGNADAHDISGVLTSTTAGITITTGTRRTRTSRQAGTGRTRPASRAVQTTRSSAAGT